ncbi:MAG: hypothetical protein KAS07_02115 [Candidatus Pacebacteria bacterium]|nr:hypothetical protein [Candidatus Paceibacterota bacterium]
MGLFSGGKKNEIIAIFDIGSGSVGGALVELRGAEKPRILFSVREDIAFQNNFKFERFFASMLRSFGLVLKRLAAKEKKVGKVMCVLSAPWYVSQTRTIVSEEQKPFLVTQKRVDHLIEKEIIKIKESFDSKYGDVIDSSTEVLEMRSTHIKLNGYETNTPFDKHAEKFEASLYVSMGSSKVLQTIREKVRAQYKVKDVSFHSFSLVSFSTLRDMCSDAKDFIVLDISGEATDITVVRQDTLVETLSFPFGKHFVLRTIASRLGISLEEAYSSMVLFVEGKATKEAAKKMNIILTHCGGQWLDMFKESLDSLSVYTILPAKIFLITDEPFSEWFAKTTKSVDCNKLSLIGEEFVIDVLRPNVLAKFGNFDINVPRDIFITIEALFAHKILNNEE